MCVGCFGLVVSTCQVIGYRKTPLMSPSWVEEIISTNPRWKSVFVCIFLSFGLLMLLCVSRPSPTQYLFHMPMTRCSLYVPKVTLNTEQANEQTLLLTVYACVRGRDCSDRGGLHRIPRVPHHTRRGSHPLHPGAHRGGEHGRTSGDGVGQLGAEYHSQPAGSWGTRPVPSFTRRLQQRFDYCR